MGGGAWPFLVGGLICLVNSDNERDFNLLHGVLNRFDFQFYHLEELFVRNMRKSKAITGL